MSPTLPVSKPPSTRSKRSSLKHKPHKGGHSSVKSISEIFESSQSFEKVISTRGKKKKSKQRTTTKIETVVVDTGLKVPTGYTQDKTPQAKSSGDGGGCCGGGKDEPAQVPQPAIPTPVATPRKKKVKPKAVEEKVAEVISDLSSVISDIESIIDDIVEDLESEEAKVVEELVEELVVEELVEELVEEVAKVVARGGSYDRSSDDTYMSSSDHTLTLKILPQSLSSSSSSFTELPVKEEKASRGGGTFRGCQPCHNSEEESGNIIMAMECHYPFATAHTVNYRYHSRSFSADELSFDDEDGPLLPGKYDSKGCYLGFRLRN